MEHAKFWQEFFQLYKDLPALWRIRSTEYTDRVLKTKCYLKLIGKLKEVYPDADREMVVKKINNFRTSYRKELRRMKESQHLGKTYKPTLWYFDCLRFLDDQDGDVGEEKSFIEDETTEEISPNTSRRRKLYHSYSKKPTSRKLSYEEQQQAQIDADILCKSWAVQYKEMQGPQKLIARKLISDILFYGCLGILNMSDAIGVQDILLRDTSNAAQAQSPTASNSSTRFTEQDFFNNDSLRNSPFECNSCSSPTNNSISELQVNEIKFEVP